MHRYLTKSPFAGDLGGVGDVDMSNMRFYSSGTLLSTPIAQNVRDAVNAVIVQAMKAMPWTGGQLQGEAALIMNDNRIPVLDPNSSAVDDDTKAAQWKEFRAAFSKVVAPAYKNEQQALAIEGQNLAANTAFWDRVYRINLAVATVGFSELAQVVKDKWAELQARIQEWSDTKEWIQRIIDHKDCTANQAEALQMKLDELDEGISGKVISLSSKIPGLQPALKEQGLGVVAIFSALAAVPTAVSIAAIVALVALIVYAISSIKGLVHDLGLDALGDAMRQTSKLLGPLLGVAVLGVVGLILYKKFSKPKAT